MLLVQHSMNPSLAMSCSAPSSINQGDLVPLPTTLFAIFVRGNLAHAVPLPYIETLVKHAPVTSALPLHIPKMTSAPAPACTTSTPGT
jgi:hypothetical protein